MQHTECKHKTTLPEMNGRLFIRLREGDDVRFTANEAGWQIHPGNFVMIITHDEYANITGERTFIPFSNIILLTETAQDDASIEAYEKWFAKEHGVSVEEDNEMRAKSVLTQALMSMGIDPETLPGWEEL